MFFQLLNCDISVIGCGGIKTGLDAFEHILCGASAVQIGTQLWKEGVGCFERISNELKLIMSEKGYQFIDDFRGKLKEI
jgi:dihydroorotate dehydrogenase (fumarate)